MAIEPKVILKIEDIANSTGRAELQQVVQRLRAIPEQSTLESILAVYKDMRAAGICPEHRTLYLIDHLIAGQVDYLVEKEEDEAREKYGNLKWALRDQIQETIKQYTSRHPLPFEDIQELLEDLLEEDMKIESPAPSISDIHDQTYKR